MHNEFRHLAVSEFMTMVPEASVFIGGQKLMVEEEEEFLKELGGIYANSTGRPRVHARPTLQSTCVVLVAICSCLSV